MSSSQAHSIENTAPLRAVLRHLLNTAFVLFGRPEIVARMGVLARSEHQRILN